MRLIDADALAARYMSAPPDYYHTSHIVGEITSAPTVKTQGWISVKDRLPGSSGIKVIVSAKTIPESVLQTKAVFVAFLGYGDGKWYTPDVDFMANAKTGNDNVHPVWEITHWMFPPEPPKEEDNANQT